MIFHYKKIYSEGHMIRNKMLLVALFLLLLIASITRSQTAIPDEKQRLITKLIVATEADRNIGTIFDAFMRAYIEMMPQIEESSFKVAPSAPAAFRKELIALANQTMTTIADRTRQRVLEDPAIKKLELEIIASVWNETFSEEELRHVLEFYETPTGHKLAQAVPVVAAKTSQRSLEVVGPLIGRVFAEVQSEEIEKLYEPVRQLEKKYNISKKSP